MPTSPPKLLCIAAHPDDIEFGCGGILLAEKARGSSMDWLICSRGESASNGTPELRRGEAESAAAILGASLHWCELGGDARIVESPEHALILARKIRELKPQIVLAPTLVENQHPDHYRVARLTRDAARLARYRGLKDLADLPGHAIQTLLYYRVSSGGDPAGHSRILFDISSVVEDWKDLMTCHSSQLQTRNYTELQVNYARLLGLECGVDYALPLYSEDGLMLTGLDQIVRSARAF